MKVFHFLAAAAAVASVPTLAKAQTAAPAAPAANAAASVAVGGTIFDPQGGEVGKIVSMTGDAVVVDTGANKATLPKSAIGSGPKGPIIAMTKAQIDEQVAAANQKASAAVEAAMVTGAPVKGKAGGAIGTIKEVSPVLIGAGVGTRTLDVKSASEDDLRAIVERDDPQHYLDFIRTAATLVEADAR